MSESQQLNARERNSEFDSDGVAMPSHAVQQIGSIRVLERLG